MKSLNMIKCSTHSVYIHTDTCHISKKNIFEIFFSVLFSASCYKIYKEYNSSERMIKVSTNIKYCTHYSIIIFCSSNTENKIHHCSYYKKFIQLCICIFFLFNFPHKPFPPLRFLSIIFNQKKSVVNCFFYQFSYFIIFFFIQ